MGKVRGRKASVALLAEFDVKTLSDLHPSKFDELAAVCAMMLAAE